MASGLLFDECVDLTLAVPAFSPHAQIVLVRDILPGANDHVVLADARSRGFILVTEDAGFGRLLFHLKAPSPKGIILIALDPLPRHERLKRLMVIAAQALTHAQGAFVTIGPKTVRTRKL